MATISNTPRPGYVWDSTDNVWYPIGVGGHSHPDYITQATAISPTTVDAKGDLLVGSAADTISRLAVGNSGEQIVADSSTSTGLRYQTGYNGNAIINGSMDIWQRGTTFTTTSGVAYTADRWSSWTVSAGGSVTTSRQTVSDTTNLPTIQYCTKFQRVAGNTNTGILNYFYTAESADSYRFAGQTVTLSFYAKKGANYSAASSILVSNVTTGTGTDQRMYDFTGKVEQTQNNTLTTTWQRFTHTVTIAASVTEIATAFYFTPVGTAGADDSISITGVQLELGSVATTFKRSAGGSIQGELAACQRYYVRLGGAHLYESMGGGAFESSTVGVLLFPCPVTLRIAATSVEFSSIYAWDYGAARTITNVAINNSGKNVVNLLLTLTGGTQYRPLRVETNNSLNGYIAVSAEL